MNTQTSDREKFTKKNLRDTMPDGPKTNVKDQKNYSKWSKKSAELKEKETKKYNF